MTPKERVYTAMRHRRPDRVPLFYRDVPAVEKRLLKDLKLDTRDELLEFLEIDFRWIRPEYIGPSLEDNKTGLRKNIFSVEYKYVPAGHGGHWEPVAFPLQNISDPGALDDYPWPTPDWFDFSTIEGDLKNYRDYAIMTAPYIDSSPGVLTVIQDLIGMERAMMDMLMNPDFYHALTSHIMEFYLSYIEKLYEVAGNRIDFFRIGEDYGSQQGLLFGIEQWKEFIQPSLMKMSEIPKKHQSIIYLHTCGGVADLIPLLIESGVDVLDPVQITARGMDPHELKTRYGSKLCFSGGIDEQLVLPNGTPEEVRDEVIRILNIMGKDGGYFVGPTHNFQADIPTENIVAMYQAAREWKYRD